MTRIWFTDRDLGKQFPAILADAGLTVERHGDLFAPDGSDEQWLAHCGTQGRVALTHNSRIRYVPNELAAIIEFKVQLVVLVGQAPTPELAVNFVRTLRRVEPWLDEHPGPAILKVYRPSPADMQRFADAPGRIDHWFPRA